MPIRLAPGPIVVASHNAGKVREIVDLLGPFGFAVKIGGRARPARAGGDRHDLRGERDPEGEGRGRGIRACRRSPTIPAWPSMRSAARPASIRRAGRGRRRISPSPCGRSRTRCRRRARQRRRSAARSSSPRWRLPRPTGEVETFTGRVDGTLVWPPRGDQGFGYDPMFLPDGHARTFGEMSAEEKHGWRPGSRRRLSHRARAFKLLAERLPRRAAMSAADRRTGERHRFRRLCPLAVLRGQVPVLRFQQPCPPSAAGRGALFRRARARACTFRRADAGAHRHLASFSAAARRR